MLRKQRRVRWCSLIGSDMRTQGAKEEIVFSIDKKCSQSVTYQSNVDPPTLCTVSQQRNRTTKFINFNTTLLKSFPLQKIFPCATSFLTSITFQVLANSTIGRIYFGVTIHRISRGFSSFVENILILSPFRVFLFITFSSNSLLRLHQFTGVHRLNVISRLLQQTIIDDFDFGYVEEVGKASHGLPEFTACGSEGNSGRLHLRHWHTPRIH